MNESQSISATGTDLVLWSQLRSRWRDLHPAERRGFLRSAARALYELWKGAVDLEAVPVDLWAFKLDASGPIARLPPHTCRRLPHVTRHAHLVTVLADWQIATRDVLSRSESLYFLREFLRPEALDRAAFQHAAVQIALAERREKAIQARSIYRRHLDASQPKGRRTGSTISGMWSPDRTVQPALLHRALEAAEDDPSTRIIKSNPIICVMRANVLGYDALIKRYDLPRWINRLKYHFRASRARRAWAAAHTLLQLDIPTPEPLGFLEIFQGRVPARSYIITAFLADAVPAYRWIKTRYARQSPEARKSFRNDLLRAFLGIYHKGLYHADTKSPNLLLRAPEDPAQRTFYWIDLECVQSGVSPTRRQVVRNLVQLNGSVRSWVDEADRFEFLEGVAKEFPWVMNPCVARKIRRWTRRRLLKEVRRHCGA